MSGAAILLAVALAWPAVLLSAVAVRLGRPLARAWLVSAPAPALAAALVSRGTELSLPGVFALSLDDVGAMLLGASALLWMAAAALAAGPSREGGRTSFAAWWLLTLVGSIWVFMAADLPGFYLAYSVVSLAAYGFVVHDAPARRTAVVYMAFALLGEAVLLLAFVLLAAAMPDGNVTIADAVAALPGAAHRTAILVLLIVGFGMKIGLVPLHVWMPLTYRAAPAAAAAVLSGAAVKAGIIGLIRFLPFGTPLPEAGHVLMAIGMVSALYGVALGLTQRDPKVVLAYSSVSQMGLLAAALGSGLASGSTAAPMLVAFYGALHVFVKGGLFLSPGVSPDPDQRRLGWQILPMAIMALSLGGLPFSGGAAAKYAIKPLFDGGFAEVFATVSAIASSLLMGRFLLLVTRGFEASQTAGPTRWRLPWLVVVAASVVPLWFLFPYVTGLPAAVPMSISAIWQSAWPIALGVAMAFGLSARGVRLPAIPAGDVLVLVMPLVRRSGSLWQALENVDAQLRRWPVAGMALLAILVALAVLMRG